MKKGFKAENINKEERKPTNRQKVLYDWIVDFYEDCKEPIPADGLVYGVNSYLDGKERYNVFHSKQEYKEHNRHDICSALREDVEEINRNPAFDKIIICKDNTYKLAGSKEEVDDCLGRIDRKLSYYQSLKNIILKKKRRNGQGVVGEDKFHQTY